MAEFKPLIKEWILGSSSKWRQGIFKEEFGTSTFAAADIDEKAIRHPKAEMMTQLIAKAKADEIIRRGDLELKDCILVCCDQVIRFCGEVREKPLSHQQCRKYLSSYMENPNEFVECINGICIYYNGRFLTHYEISKLTFKNLSSEKIESLITHGDVMTCAGGFTVSDMEVGQLHGTINGVEGLPVETIRGLGNLCSQLHVHGNIMHCTFDLGVLIKHTEPVGLLTGVEELLDQIQAANISFRLFNGSVGSIFDTIKPTTCGKALLKAFGDNIVCDEEFCIDAVGSDHAIVFISDWEKVGELVESGINVVVVGERNKDKTFIDVLQIDSFSDFNFNQLI